jgi:thiol-disulfide isomerase/thioredoxin
VQPGSKDPPTSQPSGHKVAASNPAASKPAVPIQSIRFTATTLDGDPIEFPGDYKGKLVLVSFWATWCPVCAREIPFWQDAYARYGERVAFLGLATDKLRKIKPERVQQHVLTTNMPWPQVYEESPELSDRFHADTLPWSFLVDGDTGKVLRQGDELRKKRLAPLLEKAIQSKFGTTGHIATGGRWQALEVLRETSVTFSAQTE